MDVAVTWRGDVSAEKARWNKDPEDAPAVRTMAARPDSVTPRNE